MYEKPNIVESNEIAEGVYTASGSNQGCYTVSAYIHQRPETGRGDYRIQINGKHTSDHTRDKQILTVEFNQPVTFKWSQGTLIGGDGSAIIEIELYYHQNPNDNIGFGDLTVESDPGLEILSVNITD